MRILQNDPSQLALLPHLVDLLKDNNRTPEAALILDKSASAARSVEQLYYLSGVYSRLGDQSGAEKLLLQAHERDASNASVCNDLGYTLADAGRDMDKAEQLIRLAVNAEPENVMFLDSLGWLLYKRSKFEDASSYLEISIQKSIIADPVVLDHAGDALYRIGKPDYARTRWQQALDQIQKGMPSDTQLPLKLRQKIRSLDKGQPVDVASEVK